MTLRLRQFCATALRVFVSCMPPRSAKLALPAHHLETNGATPLRLVRLNITGTAFISALFLCSARRTSSGTGTSVARVSRSNPRLFRCFPCPAASAALHFRRTPTPKRIVRLAKKWEISEPHLCKCSLCNVLRHVFVERIRGKLHSAPSKRKALAHEEVYG